MTRKAVAVALAILGVGCQQAPQRLSFELPPEVTCEPSEQPSACVASAPFSVVVADLDDRDGDEIVVLSASSFVTVVSIGDATPTAVSMHTGYDGRSTADRMVVCDMDGDGASELVHDGGYRLRNAAIWRQTPDPTAWDYQRLGQIGIWMVQCAWARDEEASAPELLGFASSGPRVISVVPGPEGNGVTFQEAPLGLPEEVVRGYWSTSMIGLDGERFLVLADPHEGVLHVARHEGDGWLPAADVAVSDAPLVDAAWADLDGDGRDELAVVATGDTISMLWVGSVASAGDGYLAERFAIELSAAVTEVRAADLDGDGIVDLFATNLPGTTVRWLRGLGDGTLAADDAVDLGGPLMGAAPADVDGDGIVELAVLPASQDRLDVLWDVAGTQFSPGSD